MYPGLPGASDMDQNPSASLGGRRRSQLVCPIERIKKGQRVNKYSHKKWPATSQFDSRLNSTHPHPHTFPPKHNYPFRRQHAQHWIGITTHNLLDIYSIYFNTNTSKNGYKIVHVVTVIICCCCLCSKYQFVFYFIKLKRLALTTSSPAVIISHHMLCPNVMCRLMKQTESHNSPLLWNIVFHGTIITKLNQQGHIVTYVINNNSINLIKSLTCCGLWKKCDDITVVKRS